MERQLGMFLAGSVLLAIVAAANVSLFLLARAPGRRRELGIRLAVGAPLPRLARQLASEAGLLVVVAALLGLLISIWLSLFLRSFAFMRDANWMQVTLLDWRVLALVGVFLTVLTLLVSLAPIIGIRRLGIGASSRHVVARASMTQRLAGTAQIGAAATLGAAAVAFSWHLGALILGDPGYELNDRHVVAIPRFGSLSSDIEDPLQRLVVEHARRTVVIEAIPGVTAVGFGDPVPGYGGGNPRAQIPDPADSTRTIDVHIGMIDSAFLEVLGLRLLYGRAPEVVERGVVLVNETLARTLWGREDVVGERLPGSNRWGREGAEIIGVLADLSFGHPAADALPYVFTPGVSPVALVASPLTAAGLRQAFDQVIANGEIDIAIAEIRPLAEMRSELIAPDRARGLLTIATAALVVLLAAFGFYGTQRYLVAAGRREYAIRASLGAGPAALGRLVYRRGLLICLPGLAIGIPLAFIAVAWLRGDYLADEISPFLVTVATGFGLILVLLAATVGPAREARRTQPVEWLGED